MSEVVKGNFAREGFEIGDKRALALHDWMIELGRQATVEEMKAEIARLKRIMPSPEDEQ